MSRGKRAPVINRIYAYERSETSTMVVIVTYLNKLYEPSRKQTYPRTIAYVTNTNSNKHTFSVPTPTLKVQEERPLSDFMGKQAVKCPCKSRQGLTIARPQIYTMGGIKAPTRRKAPGVQLNLMSAAGINSVGKTL